MEKTEKQYADELIDQYFFIPTTDDYYCMSQYMAKQCAINDVTNTIKALKGEANYKKDLYYQTVLQILKERL